MFITFIEVYHF